ncbi:type III-B CRISPR-associated protein Cas10/Cmr2 [Tindallia californiensis]|uniref:CRISPR-associated protein, Cmr2 family n=1 Tax=Tindallia californiensis TaxID=159292 RepID=A0A1H3PQD3_9FIRM|nr:type III-B CRISPR-associated protein Cas10/Cmr2 [Tindallia californiensis]SDZ03115.1 CRISPR-associated protein, Cmr2 family [Tindallia californiensis]
MKSKSLLLISIGPVQSFIESARKLEDLWAGSFVLAWLSENAIHTLQETAKERNVTMEMVYPMILNHEPYKIKKCFPEVASLPSRFVCHFDAKPEQVAEMAKITEDKVKEAFTEFCCTSVDRVFGNFSNQLKDEPIQRMKNMTADQVKALIEVFWAIESMETEDFNQHRRHLEMRLAAVKNNRRIHQLYQDGLVCTVCGEREALSGWPVKKTAGIGEMKELLKTTWDSRKPEFSKRIKPGEFLCGVCLGKRGARNFFQDKYNSKYHFQSFPSVRSIANFSNYYEQEEPENRSYYAVLLMDGDNMGKWFSKSNKIEDHQELSKRLAFYASETVPKTVEKDHGGKLVYAGGDDVLAFLPLQSAFQCAKELRMAFGSDQQGFAQGATASMGMVITHDKAPLSKVLRQVRRMEKTAKAYQKGNDDSIGKDALAIGVMTRGEIRETCFSWEDVDVVMEIKNSYQQDLTTTFLFTFAKAFLPLIGKEYHKKVQPVKNSIENKELLRLEMERLVTRSLKDSSKKTLDPKEFSTMLIQLHEHMPSTLQFIHLLEALRFIAQKDFAISKEMEEMEVMN